MTNQSDMQKLKDAIEEVRSGLVDLHRSVQPLLAAQQEGSRTTEIIEDRAPLYEALREWRKTEAASRELAAFQVFSNQMLTEIANGLPADKFDLGTIKGVGPDRFDKYGDAVLAIVTKYRGQ